MRHHVLEGLDLLLQAHGDGVLEPFGKGLFQSIFNLLPGVDGIAVVRGVSPICLSVKVDC